MKKTLLVLVFLTACTSSSPNVLGSPIGEPSDVLSNEAAVISPECDQYFSSAARAGLPIPLGWNVLCPSGAIDEQGRSHWGITCFGGACPEGQGPYVSINLNRIGDNQAIRDYVVRHELCHAHGQRNELAADQCAAEHGASLRYSPYQ